MISLARRRLRGAIVISVLAVAVLVPAGLWLRTSSLVRVSTVTVSGISGPQSAQIRKALTGAGRGMTTLAVDEDVLRAAVSAYPIVHDLHTSTDLPHGLNVEVNAYVAVAAVTDGTHSLAVASDGAVLRGAPDDGLARIAVKRMPSGDRIGDRAAMRAIRLLAAAPAALRARVERVSRGGPRGLSATLGDGPKLYFGGDERARAKWAAAVQVLAQSSAGGASYVDLRLPERPVAGDFQPRPVDDSGSTLG